MKKNNLKELNNFDLENKSNIQDMSIFLNEKDMNLGLTQEDLISVQKIIPQTNITLQPTPVQNLNNQRPQSDAWLNDIKTGQKITTGNVDVPSGQIKQQIQQNNRNLYIPQQQTQTKEKTYEIPGTVKSDDYYQNQNTKPLNKLNVQPKNSTPQRTQIKTNTNKQTQSNNKENVPNQTQVTNSNNSSKEAQDAERNVSKRYNTETNDYKSNTNYRMAQLSLQAAKDAESRKNYNDANKNYKRAASLYNSTKPSDEDSLIGNKTA